MSLVYRSLPYSEIRDTMLHELTHCVHGPHDAKFWALFRELCRECKALDWRGGGHRVGGVHVLNPAPFAEDDTNDKETVRRAAKLIGDTMKLTGDLHCKAAVKHGGGYSPRGSPPAGGKEQREGLGMRGLNLF